MVEKKQTKAKVEKKFCKECGQQFKEADMMKVKRTFYCKECAVEVMEKQSE